MTEKNDPRRRDATRRGFLRSTGITLTGLFGFSGVGTATSANDKIGPTKTEATVIKRFRPDGDQYTVKKRTVSPAFKDRFGGPTITYEPEPVPREFIPDEHTDPDKPFTVQYRDKVVVGTLEEQQAAERGTHETNRLSNLSLSQSYDGPKYVYESASGAEDQDLYERTAPINVAWGNSINKDASELQSYMKNQDWEKHWTMPGSASRYILYNGSAQSQNEHIYKEIYYARQLHIRVYNVSVDSSVEPIQVIGNAHRDPLDHNHIGDEPWEFNDARDETSSDWGSWGQQSETVFMGGTQWETHDGNMDVIYS